jgi:arsenate reductase
MQERSSKVRVICLDRENSIRSQMAEAFLRHIGGDKFEIHSGGLEPVPIHPLVVQVMKEVGVSLDGQEPKSCQVYFGKEAFQVAIMVAHPDERENPRLFPGAMRVERWPNEIPLAGNLPADQLLERFRRIRDRIQVQAQTWIKAQKDAETGVFSAKRLAVSGH